jgi:pimeloyl-ACP methyl ester carboxylesterase
MAAPASMQAMATSAISAGVRGEFGLRDFGVAPLIAASMMTGSPGMGGDYGTGVARPRLRIRARRGDAMATARMQGAELYYEMRGHGPPLLAIHGGLGLDHTYMKSTLAPLEQDFSVTYYDQRGNGRSDRGAATTLTMEQLADDAAALLGHLGHREAVVFGHSYGGFVAQELAIRAPGPRARAHPGRYHSGATWRR